MRKSAPIGLVSAAPFESGRVVRAMARRKALPGGITKGLLYGKPACHINSGIAAANAAHAATLLIERCSPALLINFGIGGAYPSSGLGVGDVAAAEREVYADIGVLSGRGLAGLEKTGFPLLTLKGKKHFGSFGLDRALLSLAVRLLEDERVRAGVFLTVAQATGTEARARALRRKYKAICENMEGAAVAHVCAIHGLPVLELRGVSNMVGKRDLGKWDKDLASENCQRAVLRLIERLP